MPTKKNLCSFRTNTKFVLNYEKMELVPELELILITDEPEYKINKNNDIARGSKISDFRIFTSLEGINAMIGQLQVVAAELQKFEQLSTGLNGIIKAAKDREDKK